MGEVYKDDIFLGGVVDASEDVRARAKRVAANASQRQRPKTGLRVQRGKVGKLRPSELRRRGFRPPTPEEKQVGITHWVCKRHPILWIPGKGEFRPHRRAKEVPESAVQLNGTPNCKRCKAWKTRNRAQKR